MKKGTIASAIGLFASAAVSIGLMSYCLYSSTCETETKIGDFTDVVTNRCVTSSVSYETVDGVLIDRVSGFKYNITLGNGEQYTVDKNTFDRCNGIISYELVQVTKDNTEEIKFILK